MECQLTIIICGKIMTLIRLETYAALDAKLYCPSHIKCVMPSR